jgi:hypothetical protein
MKNYLILVIALLLFFSCSQEKENKNTEIYVTVIKQIPTDSIIDIKEYIQFSDNRGNKPSLGDSLEKFTSIVNPGKKVKWKEGKNSLQKVKITEINFKEIKGNINILEKKTMRDDSISGQVIGKVKKKRQVKDGSEEQYSISFEIDSENYTIDPIIKFHVTSSN